MTRITTTLLVMVLLLNGAVGVMEASGLANDLGVEFAPGVSDAVQDIKTDAQAGFSVSGGMGETLFSLFASGLGVFKLAVEVVFALPQLLRNLGIPGYVVTFVMVPVYVISLLEFAYVATGRDLL